MNDFEELSLLGSQLKRWRSLFESLQGEKKNRRQDLRT